MARKRRRHFLVEGAEEALADSPFIRTKVKDQVFAWSFTYLGMPVSIFVPQTLLRLLLHSPYLGSWSRCSIVCHFEASLAVSQ